MKTTTKIAIASLLSAAGAVLNAFASEYGGGETPEAAATPEGPKTRKPRTPAAAPAAAEPEDVQATLQRNAEAEETGKTYDELRALIAPIVKDGQGEEVKKVIAKYSETGLKGMEAKHHAAFEKDIQALSY